MRFNQQGSYLAGVAGASTTINGHEIVPGRCCGGWFWLNPTTPAGQVCDNAGCRLETATGTRLADHGANFFAAGGGRWASDLGPGFVSNFVSGPEYANSIPLWIDHDGLAAVLLKYNEGGPVRLVRTDNSVQDFPGPIVGPLYSGESHVIVNDGLLTFRTAQGFQIWDDVARRFVTNARAHDSDFLSACRVNGAIVVCERLISDASVQVRYADQPNGVPIATWAPGQETFYPHICALDANTVRVGWSWHISDLAVQTRDVAIADIPGADATQKINVSVVRSSDGAIVAMIAIGAIAGYYLIKEDK